MNENKIETQSIIFNSDTELLAIRCSINCITQIQDIVYIIVITDVISTTKYIFNMFIHLYQLHSIAISKDLRGFFNKNSNNSILF